MGDARGIGRRRVLEGAGALLLTASMPRALAAVGTKKPSLVLAPLRTTVGNGVEGGLGVFDLEAGTHRAIPASIVGHSVVGNPARPRRVVLVGQRPGTQSVEIDLVDGAVTRVIDSAADRYFYGHGAYSTDGAMFYATENDRTTGAGVVTVRDATTFAVLGELPTHGVAPHEMRPLGEGKTFVICNGGVTNDGAPAEQQPALCYVDAASGALLSRDRLPKADRSIRHLAVTERNDVAVALRIDGAESTAVALRWRGDTLTEMTAPADVAARTRSLALSVAIHEPTAVAGFTHPPGNLVTFWNMREKRFVKSLPFDEPHGITVTADGRHYLVSTYTGGLHLVDAESFATRTLEARGLNWKHSMTWRS